MDADERHLEGLVVWLEAMGQPAWADMLAKRLAGTPPQETADPRVFRIRLESILDRHLRHAGALPLRVALYEIERLFLEMRAARGGSPGPQDDAMTDEDRAEAECTPAGAYSLWVSADKLQALRDCVAFAEKHAAGGLIPGEHRSIGQARDALFVLTVSHDTGTPVQVLRGSADPPAVDGGTYSCLICGSTTALPHICPALRGSARPPESGATPRLWVCAKHGMAAMRLNDGVEGWECSVCRQEAQDSGRSPEPTTAAKPDAESTARLIARMRDAEKRLQMAWVAVLGFNPWEGDR